MTHLYLSNALRSTGRLHGVWDRRRSKGHWPGGGGIRELGRQIVQPAPTRWWTAPGVQACAGVYGRLVETAKSRDRAAAGALRSQMVVSESSRDFFASVAPLSIYSEDVGGQAAEALLGIGLPAGLRGRVVRAMWDEVRHSDLFHQLSLDLEVSPTSGDKAPVALLMDTLEDAENALEFAIVHTELEALAQDVFMLCVRAESATRVGDVYQVIASDEATHVRLGFDIVRCIAARGMRVDRDRVRHLYSRASLLSPLGDPSMLTPLAERLSRSLASLTQDLTVRRDQRMALVLEETA